MKKRRPTDLLTESPKLTESLNNYIFFFLPLFFKCGKIVARRRRKNVAKLWQEEGKIVAKRRQNCGKKKAKLWQKEGKIVVKLCFNCVLIVVKLCLNCG